MSSVSISPPTSSSALPPMAQQTTLALKLFRREPAISRFVWAFHPYPHLIRALCNVHRFDPPRNFTSRFSLDMDSSPGFGSTASNLSPYSDSLSLRLRLFRLNLATDRNSLAHSPIGTPSPGRGNPASGSDCLVSIRFQDLFHSPIRGPFHLSLTVLVHYRSPKVFSLGEWSPQLLTGFACPVILRIPTRPSQISPTGLSPSPVRLSSAVPLSGPALPSVLLPPVSLRQLGLDCSAFVRHY